MTALALFIVGAPRAGALIAQWPRSVHAQIAIAETRRLARGERRRIRIERLTLAPAIEAAAQRQREERRVCAKCREPFSAPHR